MADNPSTLVVFGFKTTYETHPKRGTDPLNDVVDDKGFLVDEKGKRILESVAEDWVTYAPAHSPQNTRNTERVRFMRPDPDRMGTDENGTKLAFMTARWALIEPAYEAWKRNAELPINGTSLTIWPGINEGQVEVFRQLGIRTVEGVRDLSETAVERVKLPNMRELRNQAKLFLENMSTAAAAAREDARDAELESMRLQMEELQRQLAQQGAQPIAGEPSGPDADEVAVLRAQLDAAGIEYDKRWAAPKLRSALATPAAA